MPIITITTAHSLYRPQRGKSHAKTSSNGAKRIIFILLINMSDSDSSSQEQVPKLTQQKSQRSIPRQNSLQTSITKPPPKPIPLESDSGLYEQNKKLRRKLKQLSIRLDEELEKAAENKLKLNHQKYGRPVSLESQPLELQNAYKMIERLQKTVKDYESKEAYQITVKRVMDLEGIIKKKDSEIETLKLEVKTQKKMIHDKDKHVEQLLENTKKMGNPAEDKQVIKKLKEKMKKLAEERQIYKRKEMEKHQKLVGAERRIVELEQGQHQMPIGRQQALLKEIEDNKNKYKEAMQRVERQNIYITKLNEKLTRQGNEKMRRAAEQRTEQSAERKKISRSMEELPDLKKKVPTSGMLEHLPSPKGGMKLRRY